jgi:hypothetical protein
MSSGFSCGPLIVWVSNGTAESFESGWLEKLEKKADEHAPAIIQLPRMKVETSGPGMYGFGVIIEEIRELSWKRREAPNRNSTFWRSSRIAVCMETVPAARLAHRPHRRR